MQWFNAAASLALLLWPVLLDAQSATAGRAGRRAMLPAAREIALARSAAPVAVGDSASVYVLTDTGYVLAVRGSNGVACYVSRSWPESIEPHCFDAEGAATIMPMEMRRVELLHQGRVADEVEREIALGLASGRYRLPRRPAMSYMMSGGQILYNDEGRRVGRWQPHLMIYYPFLTGSDLGLAGDDPNSAILVDPGKPTANMMIILRQFVEPRSSSGSP
jgi:hypothetical protein